MQMAGAMWHLQKNRVLHRDLKLGNWLYTDDGKVLPMQPFSTRWAEFTVDLASTASAALKSDDAGQIRWITNRYLYIGNAAWLKAHKQLLGGTIPCCAGFGVNKTGGFLQYDTPDQIQAYTLQAPYTGLPVLPNIGMSLSTTVGDAAMGVLISV